MGVWEPTFKWDSPDGGDVDDSSIMSLYTCLKDAMGPAVTMDSGRQTKTQRQPPKAVVEENTNSSINLRAAKLTKCIVNYMSAGAQTAQIIEYGVDLTGDFDLGDAGFDLDVGSRLHTEASSGGEGQSWTTTWGVGAEHPGTVVTGRGPRDSGRDHGGAVWDSDADNTGVDMHNYLESLSGQIDLESTSAVFDIDESIYEELYYVAAPSGQIKINNEPD